MRLKTIYPRERGKIMDDYKNFKIFIHCGKVYINCSHDFFIEFEDFTNLNELLIIFAKTVQTPNNVLITNQELHMRKIRKIILKEANSFISEFETVPSSENASSYISKRQFKELEKVFAKKEGRISCYSLIILRSIFFIMKQYGYDFAASDSIDIKKYILFIHNVVTEYFNEYSNDVIAHFLIECYNPIISLIENGNTELKFPAIPKRYLGHKSNDE